MPLKQSSFDFDFSASETASETVPVVEETVVVLDEEPREINIPVERKPVEKIVEPRKSPRGRMKLSDMDANSSKVEIPEDKELYEKSYYSIGVVSEMFNVNQSLIRYWEKEFTILKPKKNKKGDRYFRPDDVKNLKLIYQLLRERKFTIEGAKDFLKKNKNAEEKFAMVESLQGIKSFLNELKANL